MNLLFRYGKIFIMTDADVDGAHIRSLLLTFFIIFVPKLIDENILQVSCPPLHKAIVIGSKKRIVAFSRSVEELEQIFANSSGKHLGLTCQEKHISFDKLYRCYQTLDKNFRIVNLQWFKGLGEMTAQELWDTTMDPNTRITRSLYFKSPDKGEILIDKLMGHNIVERRRFIHDCINRKIY